MANELSVLLSKFVPHYDFVLVQVNPHKFGSFFNYKDRLPVSMRSSLVYKFSCARCASEYVGSSSRILHTRIREHEGRSHRTGAPLSVPPHSNVRLHTASCGVGFDDSNFEILSACERNRETLLILESMYILKTKPKINDLGSAYKLRIC